jgi:hypothetical protein
MLSAIMSNGIMMNVIWLIVAPLSVILPIAFLLNFISSDQLLAKGYAADNV